MMSLIDTGTPSSSPFGMPLIQRASDALAFSRISVATRLKALSCGFRSSMRFMTAAATSTGENARVR
jgi:hypothetical protein